MHVAEPADQPLSTQVEAKKAVPKEENPTPAQPADAAQKTRKIFVGGLAPSVDEQVLRQYFEQFGQVDDAVVMYDHDNKRPRGFGFITFAEEESVDNVFSHGAMQNIHDKQIEIKPAVPRDQMPPQARRAPPFFPGRGMAGGAAAFPPGRAPPYGFRQPGLPAAYPGARYQGAGPSPRAAIASNVGYGSPQDRGAYGAGLMQYSQQVAGGAGGSRYSPAPGPAAGGRFMGQQPFQSMYGLGFAGAGDTGIVQPGSSPVSGMYSQLSQLQQIQQQQQQLGQQAPLNGYPGQLDMSGMGGKLGLRGPDLAAQPGAAAAAAAAAAMAKSYGVQGALGSGGVGGFPSFPQPGGQQFPQQPDAAGYQSADQVAAAAAAAGYADPVAHLPGTSPLGTTPEFNTFATGSAGGWPGS